MGEMDDKLKKAEYYKKFNKIMTNNFTFLPKLQGADLDIILGHFISNEPLEKIRARLKRKYEMTDGDITKLFIYLKNQFKDLEN